MFAMLPVNVRLAEPFEPAVIVRPMLPPSVKTPCETLKATCTVAEPASGSAMETAFPLADE